MIQECRRCTKETAYWELIWAMKPLGICKCGTLFSALNPRSWITQVIVTCKSVYIHCWFFCSNEYLLKDLSFVKVQLCVLFILCQGVWCCPRNVSGQKGLYIKNNNKFHYCHIWINSLPPIKLVSVQRVLSTLNFG